MVPGEIQVQEMPKGEEGVMKTITIEVAGTDWLGDPTLENCDNAIEALERAINNKPQCRDFVPLQDVKSIMVGIKEQLFPAQHQVTK